MCVVSSSLVCGDVGSTQWGEGLPTGNIFFLILGIFSPAYTPHAVSLTKEETALPHDLFYNLSEAL